MTEADQILFEKYQSGQLNTDEVRDFEQRLNSDAAFKSSYLLFVEMDNFLEDKSKHGQTLNLISEISSKEKARPKRNRRLFLLFTIIASLVLIALIWIMSSQEKTETPSYADLYIEPTWPVNRGASDELEIIFSAGLNKNPQAIIDSLKSSSLSEDTKGFWLSEVFANQILPDSVLYYLPNSDNLTIVQRDRRNYLEIISLVALGNYSEAQEKINNLPSDTDQFYLNKYLKI